MRTTKRARFLAGLFAGATLTGLLLTEARAQIVSSCQPGPALLFPQFTDNTPGWLANDTVADTKYQLVLGDIDGDGQDELIALPNGQNRVEVWHWSFNTWTPMGQILDPTQTSLKASLGNGSATQIRVANVDGDNRKDVIIYDQDPDSSQNATDTEQVWKYNPATYTWSMITSYYATRSDGRSYWFKAQDADVQDTRFRIGATFMEIKQFQSGNWVALPGSGAAINRSAIAQCPTGECVAFADLDKNGSADLIYLGADGSHYFILTPTKQPYFSGATTKSAIAAPMASGGILPRTLNSWQMGDIDGDGQSELIFFNTSQLAAYYFNGSDFAAYPDPNSQLGMVGLPPDSAAGSLTILPHGLNAANGGLHGAAMLGLSAVLYPFQNNGTRSFLGGKVLSSSIPPDSSGSLDATGYAGYFRFAVEPGGLVMLARSSNGMVNNVEGQTGAAEGLFVDPNTNTDRGYPPYSGTPQTTAYQYISRQSTALNPDIRSLYPDPATPWPAILPKLLTMTAPPAPAEIANSDWAAAFQTVLNQTVAEVTALQTVNEFYTATGQLLTNTYLVKDATLQEITDALALPTAPDIAAAVLSDITTALNGLGAALYTAQSALILPDLAEEVQDILGSYGAFASTLGTITGDTAQYSSTTPANPTDPATGQYDLKLALDNLQLGALTSNTCHQLQTLSAWNQAKPLSDGIVSGLIPLDLASQQTVIRASQGAFALAVWQTLAPTVWNWEVVLNSAGAPFMGNGNYPAAGAVFAYCIRDTNQGTFQFPASLVLENAGSHQFPNLTALNSLLNAPPAGLGANPTPLLFGTNGWHFSQLNDLNPLAPNIEEFEVNTGLTVPFCTSVITPNGATVQASSAAAQLRRAGKQALAGLAQLSADVKANLTDTQLAHLLTMDLDVATARLRHAVQFEQEPKDTLLLLNDVLTRLQFHATQNAVDKSASDAEATDAVAIRDLLLNSESNVSAVKGQ